MIRQVTKPLEVPGCGFRMWGALEPLAVWEATERFSKRVEAPPFWAHAWPGGIALAQWVTPPRVGGGDCGGGDGSVVDSVPRAEAQAGSPALAIFAPLRCRASLEEALFATNVFAADAMGVGEVICEDNFAGTFGM